MVSQGGRTIWKSVNLECFRAVPQTTRPTKFAAASNHASAPLSSPALFTLGSFSSALLLFARPLDETPVAGEAKNGGRAKLPFLAALSTRPGIRARWEGAAYFLAGLLRASPLCLLQTRLSLDQYRDERVRQRVRWALSLLAVQPAHALRRRGRRSQRRSERLSQT